nr:response regulator [Lachnospiraceae bacterium]
PMNAIVGMTAIATAHIDDKEQVQNCLKKIALSGKHLLGLINDVLDMSKIESGKMTLSMDQISLPEVVEGIVGIVQSQVRGKKQSFNVHVDSIEVENVYCDSVRLNQVLLNLLSNAVKYTQEEGTIWFSLYEEESPKGENYIRTHVKVEDNGIGMDEEFQKKIFDSYSRADSKRVHKTEGAGLGMAITKYIVDAMEGTIQVESELGKGTKFHLILDLEKAEMKEVDMILPAWKMLVVDDDEMLCQTTVEALKDIGVKADWTLSGEKAIALVEEHHKKQDDYQIILLDWKLPGMNGLQVAREIRKSLGHNVPILLISAYDWSEFEADARDAGVDGFISKPLFKSTLFHGLRKYMNVEEPEKTLDEQNVNLSGRRVLVAEDNDLNWEVLNELLSDVGLELEWAENGQICVDKFGQNEEGYYDAILMDVRMPVMNGYEATEAIRAMGDRPDAQSIPIIAMTADAFSEDVQRCLDCGMNAHTAKPINLDEVLFLLRKYFSTTCETDGGNHRAQHD